MHNSESCNSNAVQGKISKRWLLYEGFCLLFERCIYKKQNKKKTKKRGIQTNVKKPDVAEISGIHRSTLQSVLLANLYFNYDQSLVGPTGVQLLDFCCSSVSELNCC